MKLVVTDLDGTLLNNKEQVSDLDFQTLIKLGEKHIIRVVATGRSIFSANKVLSFNFPIDYLIFSTGAGIMNWQTKKIMYKSEIPYNKTIEIIELLKGLNLDFMVQEPIPNNHCFYYHCFNENNIGFKNRLHIYRDYAQPLIEYPENAESCQFVIILPNDIELYNNICNRINGVNLIRATSPINDNHIWLEVFPDKISKGTAINVVCKLNGIEAADTIGIGNDYNDIDMLEFVARSFVVDNSPEVLKDKYNVVSSNNNSGFSEAVNSLIEL